MMLMVWVAQGPLEQLWLGAGDRVPGFASCARIGWDRDQTKYLGESGRMSSVNVNVSADKDNLYTVASLL
jgi:hypothetical protein